MLKGVKKVGPKHFSKKCRKTFKKVGPKHFSKSAAKPLKKVVYNFSPDVWCNLS
jgi:hypothetical protein